MPDQPLIISFPVKQVSPLKSALSSQRPVPYVYFGGNYSARRVLEDKLGNDFIRIDIAQLHDQVADDIRGEHVAWIDGLNRAYGADSEWWFGTISSRNVYTSQLFQHCCYLEILARLWDIPASRPGLIFVESAGLARAIARWAEEKGIETQCCNWAGWQPLSDYVYSFFRWGYFALVLMMRQLAARASRKNRRPHQDTFPDLAIVDTFVHDSCLTEAGAFTDHYFPHLHEFLAARGFSVLVHPVLYGFGLHFFSVYRRLRRSETRFIIAEDFLRARDYLSILTFPLRAGRHKIKAPRFRGFDLADLLTAEQRNRADLLSLNACLIYRLFLRLGESGLRPRLVIDWYENQVIDKAVAAGVRQAFPQTRLIGVQLFLHLSNMLHLFPSPAEAEAGMVPDLVLETSEYQCSIARVFDAHLPCAPAAALKQTHVFEESGPPGNQPDPKALVVLLPFDLAESMEMLDTLAKGMDRLNEPIPVLVKCHPDFQPEELRRAVGYQNWPSRFEIFAGNLPQALARAAMVVSANSSSMLEAVVRGIPAIFLGRQTVLNQRISISVPVDHIVECFTTDELIAAIQRYLALTPEDMVRNMEVGKKVRDQLFLPVTPETMLPFLGMVG
jgi:hypothetical protein